MIDLELLPEFVAEASEHLEEMEANLIKLETTPEKGELINDIFRDVHTIKGSSAYLGLKVTSELAHALENLLELVRQGKRDIDSSLIDTFIATKDRLATLVSEIETYKEERTATDDLIDAITKSSNTAEMSGEKEEKPEPTADPDVMPAFSSEETAFSDNSQQSSLSLSEEELSLDLDGIFATEESSSSDMPDTNRAGNESPASSSTQEESDPEGSFSTSSFDSQIEASHEESEDGELFAIYLKQLTVNLTEIRELAAQIPASENRSDLLNRINQKIQRPKASANYMGYENLIDFYERWQAKLESFQDRLFLSEAPSAGTMIEEGINPYLTAIKKHFPQLQDITLISLTDDNSAPSASADSTSATGDTGSLQDVDFVPGNADPKKEYAPESFQDDPPSPAEDELKLDLDGIFTTEEVGDDELQETTDSRNGASPGSSPVQEKEDQEDLAADDSSKVKIEESYEETGDEELFSIYLEQLQINVSGIRELAVQIATSENRSELLNSIIEKIQRLRASANYMGYDRLIGFYEGWQEKVEAFQDRLFLNDAPSCSVLIEEGVNSYIDTIKKQFPQLQEISRVPIAGEELRLNTSASKEPQTNDSLISTRQPCGDTVGSSHTVADDEYEESIDSELFSIFLEQLKDNLDAVRDLGQQLSENDNPVEILAALSEKITRIRAAANYMGYEKLTRLYDEWGKDLDMYSDPASANLKEVEIIIQITNCIRTYTEKLLEIFPQLDNGETVPSDEIEKDLEESNASAPPSKAEDESVSDSHEDSPLVDRTDELFSSDDSPVEDEGAFYEEPEIVKEAEQDNDQGLVDRLSAALDSALGTGIVDEAGEDLASFINFVDEGTPKHEPENSPQASENRVEKEVIPSASPETPQQAEPQESTEPVQADEAAPAVAEQVERRKEDRRKENRRTVSEKSADKVFRQSLRIDANKIDELMNQAGELVINRAWFSQLYNEMKRLELHLQNVPGLDKRDFKQVKGFSFKFHEAIVALGRVANELQEGVMKVRMLPISQLFNRYPRLIRDLVHGSDKDIHLVLRGTDTELDKMIIEEIADPLIHVIRNAVDHGIEPIETRKSLGKPEKGLLKLDAYHEGSHVVIEVTDDGCGINLEAIQETAQKKGLVTRDQLSRMSPKEITELIMRPGFSTAGQITRTSGRGVGMDVVRKNVENLNGTIEIDSQYKKGTSIRIKIPLTLAVIKALLVKVRGALFTIPLIAVDETLQVRFKEIHSIKGNEVIYLRDNTIPLIRLSSIFNFAGNGPAIENPDEKTFVVIVSAGASRVGLVVDELRGQEEVVIKPLPDYLRDNKGFSGATILGDGGISLILDIHELVNLTIGRQSRKLNEPSRILSETM